MVVIMVEYQLVRVMTTESIRTVINVLNKLSGEVEK